MNPLDTAVSVYTRRTVWIVAAVAVVAILIAGAVARKSWINQGAADGKAEAAVAKAELKQEKSVYDERLLTCRTEKGQLAAVVARQNSDIKSIATAAAANAARAKKQIADLEQKHEVSLRAAVELGNMRTQASIEEQCKAADKLLLEHFSGAK